MDDDVPSYGLVEQFLVFDTDFLQSMTEANGLPHTIPIVVAALQLIPQMTYHLEGDLIEYHLNGGKDATVQLIDASQIMSLVEQNDVYC
jgi:hypothetical protein